jgi:hypothetical protein
MKLDERYSLVWDTFLKEMDSFYKQMADDLSKTPNTSVHEFLSNTYWIPYTNLHKIMEYPPMDTSRKNIGSATGFYFEQLVISLLVAYIKARLPGCNFARNDALTQEVKAISRDPDLHIVFKNNHVVLEIKVAPKKSDLESVQIMRERYAVENVRYFVIGGWVTAKQDMLSNFIGEDWISFLKASESNMETLEDLTSVDEILLSMINQLSST